MGNSCSSGQGHKDKDNMSQRSEDSASYQVRASINSEKQQTLLNHISSHSGVILEPNKAGQQLLKQGISIQAMSIVPSMRPPPPSDLKNPNLAKLMKGTSANYFSDSLSLSSPLSPKAFDKLIEDVPKEITCLTDNLQHLIMGHIAHTKVTLKGKKIVIYVCAADSNDCHFEKNALHNVVYPTLRLYCRSRGYELHIVDLHWKISLEKQQDHEFCQLCIGELSRQMQEAYVIPILFLNSSLGTQLLPLTIDSSDFKKAMENCDSHATQGLLRKWYMIDSDANTHCYRLRSMFSHISSLGECSTEDREKAIQEWSNEIEKILSVLITAFPPNLRDAYLTTVLEQEIQNTVFISHELAKRCIWINRVFTSPPKTPENDEESERRRNIIQKELRNILAEKHILRFQVKYAENGLNMELPKHKDYVTNVTITLQKHLQKIIESIIDEHINKFLVKPSYGIESSLIEELYQHTLFCQKVSSLNLNTERSFEDLEWYLTNVDTLPAIIVGPEGAGKTTLLTKIAIQITEKLPEAFLILRFVGTTIQSSTVEQLLRSIVDQLSFLVYGHKSYCNHVIDDYQDELEELLTLCSAHRPVVIILDGLDQVREYSSLNIKWIPSSIPDNIKFIVSVTEGSQIHRDLADRLHDKAFINMSLIDQSEAEDILISSVLQFNYSFKSRIQDALMASVHAHTIPLYIRVLAWQMTWWSEKHPEINVKSTTLEQLDFLLEEVENMLGVSQVQHALAVLCFTKHAVTDSEMIDILTFDRTYNLLNSNVAWETASIIWPRIIKQLAPFLMVTYNDGLLTIQWKDDPMRKAATKRYANLKSNIHQHLFEYYRGKWYNQHSGNYQSRIITQANHLDNCYNKRKLEELPYQYHQLDKSEHLLYITDISWMYDKLCGVGPYAILEDINLELAYMDPLMLTLQEFLEKNAYIMSYDGRQFYSHFYRFLLDVCKEGKMKRIFETSTNPPVKTLVPVNSLALSMEQVKSKDTQRKKYFDVIVRLPDSERYIVTISTAEDKICVWDILQCKAIRTLKGIAHPINLIPVDKHECVVLCKRELRRYNLDTGSFVARLKGVMNQKMPYYGLHDKSHLVALSRNRMYINYMNLQTGDCLTTFKAGEDRFLNSLLVSGDGRILVCGDETQKPFPLLVWNLKSKKLLYDLRIPHHDFITSLSAITFEGSYVCCVCHEIDDENPNFIVVYDLQSGTLFKKWKPLVNTVSLEISSQASCVISGLEDSRILVWDLVTGNCRFALSGHTAPVTKLILDPTGTRCLSTDTECRDKSIRLWDINKGNHLAVYTPKTKITACELTSNGNYVILALEDHKNPIFMNLRGPEIEEVEIDEVYGNEELDGQTWELIEENVK